MAYTNSPENQTYRTVQLIVDGRPMYRSGSLASQRDVNIVNMYYDRISQENKEREVRLFKRDGLATTSYSLNKTSASSPIRGFFNDVDTNTFYWAVENKVCSVSPDSGTSIRSVATLATSSGPVGFCSYLKSDGTRLIIFSDGTNLWVDNYATLSCTSVSDPDLPTPHQPYPLYLNGYIFLIKANTNDLYNSAVDDPTSWASSDFISAEISSDFAIRPYKVKNYITVLGKSSVEYFWDAGNASNSPLSRNDSPVRNVGYITGGAQSGDTVYFVGQDEKQNISVFSINSFKVERISNSVVDRTLQAYSSAQNTKGQVLLDRDGCIVSSNGHTFYVLVTPQTTWVYDIDERIWYEWKGSDGTGLKIEAAWGMYNGASYLAITNQSTMSIMSPSLYQDFGQNFTCRYTTEDSSFGTYNWKVCHRLSLYGSSHLNSGTSNAVISWSDDDWATPATFSRNLNVFSSSPSIYKCGRFRTRSFRIEYTDNYPWFIDRLELDLNIYGV